MPITAEQKKKSRTKILNSAFSLFTKHGFDNVTIDQIMQDAGMTRGAFYAHFTTKSDLYKESISYSTLSSSIAQQKREDLTDKDWINKLLQEYLSLSHVNGNSKNSCPLAFLTTDIAIRNSDIQDTYSIIYKNLNKRILDYTQSYLECGEQDILALTAMIIGGVAIGRAINDEELTQKILNSCFKTAISILD